MQTAFDKIVDMMKYATMEKKLDNLRKSHKKLLAHESSLIFIKILKATLKHVNLATARVQNKGEEFIQAKDDLIESFYEVSLKLKNILYRTSNIIRQKSSKFEKMTIEGGLMQQMNVLWISLLMKTT